MSRRDALVGALVVGLTGLLLWQTGRIASPPFIPIGPAFYPRIILVVLGLLGVGLLVQGLVATPPPAPVPPRSAPGGGQRGWLVALCFALFAVYTAALPWLGYRLSTGLFVAATQWALGSRTLRSAPACLAVGAGTAVATYVVFELYLHVLLPRGVLIP